METTPGTLLGGRIHYHQLAQGYRTGIEPVLLAATVGATPGQRVLEAGCGAGAGLLCLAHRIPGLHLTGIEVEPVLAGLARSNAERNGLSPDIRHADVAETTGRFDHVFTNPPWHHPGSTRSPDAMRDLATHRQQGGLLAWLTPLARAIVGRGSLSLVWPAPELPAALAAMQAAGFGRLSVIPLWPRHLCAPKLTLVRGRRGTGPFTLLPGLVLHGPGHGYTPEAEAILRDGAPLPH